MTSIIFDSPTQFDKSFDHIVESFKGKKGFACPVFSIVTAYRFFTQFDTSDHTHERNLKDAITVTQMEKLEQCVTMDQLITDFTKIDIGSIMVTTQKQICDNDEMSVMFPECDGSKRAVIVLKNGQYFVVMTSKNMYHVRNCHSKYQYDFATRDELINHLSIEYDFIGSDDGENHSIEWVMIEAPFELSFDTLINETLVDDDMFDKMNQLNIPDEDFTLAADKNVEQASDSDDDCDNGCEYDSDDEPWR